MTFGGAVRGLGMLLAVAAVLGGTWTLAQRHALKRAKSERTAVVAAVAAQHTADVAAQGSGVLLERLIAAQSALPAAGTATPNRGGVPDDLQRVEEFQRQVNQRAEKTASLVRSPSDLEPVLAEIERDIERTRRVNAFHAKSSAAAVRAAYRDRPQEEVEARLLELDRRLMDLSAKFDPLVREGMLAGASRQNRFN